MKNENTEQDKNGVILYDNLNVPISRTNNVANERLYSVE